MSEIESKSEIEMLRAEVALLRAELHGLKSALSGNAPALALRCSALTLEGPEGALAALSTTEDGASLALCALDGLPRAVLTARAEGGGASFLDGASNLAADLWGAGEASWAALYHSGAPALVAVGGEAGGNIELFEADGSVRAALPAEDADQEAATREMGQQA
jgi:hypothetical protein